MKLIYLAIICKFVSLFIFINFIVYCDLFPVVVGVNCSRKGTIKKWDIDSENAGNIYVQDYFRNCSFDSIAIWGTPLPNKDGLTVGNFKIFSSSVISYCLCHFYFDVGRVYFDIVTVGLLELFIPKGGINHWAFVAWDSKRPNDQVSLKQSTKDFPK